MIREILIKYWGFDRFRPLQEEIIQQVLQDKDTLALLPTGGGKSICFQVPALAREGICIVVSPLIALMNDQVEQLRKRGIKAIAVTSAMRKKEIDVALDNCIYGKYKFLYVSPERLRSELLQLRVKKMQVNLLAVDEAHCISQWGYDFRPSYLEIAEFRKIIPRVPLIALTATATPQVVEDIQQKLCFRQKNVFRKSFERKNLAYLVFNEDDKLKRLLKIAARIKGSGIVYVKTRKKTAEVAAFLKKNGITASAYHAGIPFHLRNTIQNRWIQDQTRVMVATNAFGMGIDKANVRFVVHLDLPYSIEAYFQEAGRAGRDEKKSYAVILYQESDKIDLELSIEKSFPAVDEIKQTYQALSNYYRVPVGDTGTMSYDFDITAFCETYNLNPLTVYNSIKFLEKENYLLVTEGVYLPSRVHFNVNKEQLYTFQVSNPKFDPFIKLLLRSYPGLFDHYSTIHETDMARKMNLSKEAVVALLSYLDQASVLSYIPQTNLPQLVFNGERIDVKYLRISKENHSERKKTALEKAGEMIRYAQSKHKCRSELLLAYFGDTGTSACGNCDICLAHTSRLDHDAYKNISQEISRILKGTVLTLDDLVKSLEPYPEKNVLQVIRWMLDNDQLVYDETNKLVLRSI